MQRRSDEISALQATPEVYNDQRQMQALGREQSELEEPVGLFQKLRAVQTNAAEARAMLDDATDEGDRDYLREEIESLEAQEQALVAQLMDLLLPADPNDERDVILEIRAGTGRRRSAPSSPATSSRMYTRYAERNAGRSRS